MSLRDPRPDDEPGWHELWAGYLDFYETNLPEAVTVASAPRSGFGKADGVVRYRLFL